MKYEKHISIIASIYSDVYRRTQGIVNFNLKLTDKNKKLLNVFLDVLDKYYGLDSIGENWIFDFTIFQFNIYRNSDSEIPMQLSWIYGEKAFRRWEQKEESYAYWSDQFIAKFGIPRPQNEYENKSGETFYSNMEKKRYYNTDLGFIHCNSLGLNTNSKNILCVMCKNQSMCYGNENL